MRVWQFMEVANMIVVQVGQNNIGDRIRVNIEMPQAFDRTAQERAFPASSRFRSEAGVNQKNTVRPDNDPGKVIHGHGSVMRVAADKMVRSPRVAGGIPDCENLVFRQIFSHEPAPDRRSPGIRMLRHATACYGMLRIDEDHFLLQPQSAL